MERYITTFSFVIVFTLLSGKNKQGMQCCVITARMLRPEDRKGTFNSFKKVRFISLMIVGASNSLFLIAFVEIRRRRNETS